MPTAWWLRPVKKDARVGEHREVTWKRLKGAPPAARRVHVRAWRCRSRRAQVAEAGVVEHDGHHVGRARPAAWGRRGTGGSTLPR